jgi:hypothetical protein
MIHRLAAWYQPSEGMCDWPKTVKTIICPRKKVEEGIHMVYFMTRVKFCVSSTGSQYKILVCL